MIYRLMYRGAAYADSLQYHHCIGGVVLCLTADSTAEKLINSTALR